MQQDYLNTYRSILRNHGPQLNTQLGLFVTNHHGVPVTAGEVYILGTDKSAEIDDSGYVVVDEIPFGENSFSLTTPFGTYTYGPYHFEEGKAHTFHVQVNNNTTLATPMVSGKGASSLRKRA